MRRLARAGLLAGCAFALAACAAASAGPVTPPGSDSATASPHAKGDGDSGGQNARTPSATGPVPADWQPKPDGKVLYLTFDDGPKDPYTGQILNALRANGAHATFFVIGQMIRTREDDLARITADGNAIGNHTYSHKALAEMSDDQIRDELAHAWRNITAVTPQGPCMRPPYGSIDDRVRRIARDMGMTPVMWTVDTGDFARPRWGSILSTLLNAPSGSVILMHDGGGYRDGTVAAVREALPMLKARGYRFDPLPVCVSP